MDLSDTPTTRWFMFQEVAIAALLAMKTGVRVKGVYVDRAFRKLGVGTGLTEHLIELAESEGWEYVDAFVWNPPWYLERGFEKIGVNAHGAVMVRRRFSEIPPQAP